jgi:hypothetical protein
LDSTKPDPKEKARFASAETWFFGLGICAMLAAIVVRGTITLDNSALFTCRVLLFFAWLGIAAGVIHSDSAVRLVWKLATVIAIGALIAWVWLRWFETSEIRKLAQIKFLMEDCRDNFISSHNPVEAEVLAGYKPLPSEYCNSRFAATGATLRVSDTAPPLPAPVMLAGVPPVAAASHPIREKPSITIPNATSNEKAGSVPLILVAANARDRAFVAVEAVFLHTDIVDTSATIRVKNYTSISTVGQTIVLEG